ncbi:MAG: penicillin-binding transpeptidase domain-containing protein [Ilumatobacteraceae bacterium]
MGEYRRATCSPRSSATTRSGSASTQLERSRSDVLTGDTFTQQVRALGKTSCRPTTTVGSGPPHTPQDMQQVAKFLLGQRQGSIVLMEVETGALIFHVVGPSYDPNLVADPDYDAAFEYVTELQADERDPLLANAYMQRYMPGSTF